MAWTCADCGTRYLFDAPSRFQEEDGPVCSDCRSDESDHTDDRPRPQIETQVAFKGDFTNRLNEE